MVGTKSELLRAQRLLERLLASDQEGEAMPPMDGATRHEAWNALEAIDRAIEKMEGKR